jgi:hypothetical protein
MCDQCRLAGPVPESRRTFLKRLAEAAAITGLVGCTRAMAQGNQPKVGHTGWARLVTSSPFWDVHQDQDSTLAAFIRKETALKIDLTCYPVKPVDLERLCAFPFIFTNNLTAVRDARELLNLREYLYRGGFIYIDGCVNRGVTLSFRRFYEEHIGLFQYLLPGSVVRRLPADHAIFHAYFPVRESQLQFDPVNPDYQWAGATQGLYGVFDDDHLLVILSLDHLQCGWPEKKPEERRMAQQEIANIYVYALAH